MLRTRKGRQRIAIQMAALRSDQYEMMTAQALNSLATDSAYPMASEGNGQGS
jgi:hypothetical protein